MFGEVTKSLVDLNYFVKELVVMRIQNLVKRCFD